MTTRARGNKPKRTDKQPPARPRTVARAQLAAAKPGHPRAAALSAARRSPPLTKRLDAIARMPLISSARSALGRYARSGWLIFQSLAVVAFFVLFLLRPGDAADFYSVAGQGLGLLALFTAFIVARQSLALPNRSSPGKSRSLADHVRGVVLASAALQVASCVLLLLLVLAFHRIAGSPGAVFAGAPGLLLNCVALATFAIALSSPAVTRGEWTGVLVWLVAALYSYTGSDPLAVILSVARLPLLPLAAGYNMGITGTIGWSGVLALLLVAGYIIGLMWLIEFQLAHFKAATKKPLAGAPPGPSRSRAGRTRSSRG